MAGELGREPEKYRLLMKLQVRTMQLDPRLRRRFDSSDLVQEAILKAHKNREEFEGITEAQFVNWLKRIVENVVKDKCREHKADKRDVRREQYPEQVVSDSSVLLEKIVGIGQTTPGQRLEEDKLAAAVEQLPEDQRDAIILRLVHGLPLDEVASQMKRSEKAVSQLVYRGRRTLRKILEINP
jgi:RNA polymerase sigma-70 factor (ECF subfamily)